MSFDSIVKLNIGGTVFQTSKSTLTKHEGFFKTMLETDVPIAKDDAGCNFVDRDPTHFRFILNFMRDGHLQLPESGEVLKEIRNEAQYYLLDDLVEVCNEELKKRESKNSGKIRLIETDAQFLEAVENNQKPVLIFYKYNTVGNIFMGFTSPDGFHIPTFLAKWSDKLDIYFRVCTVDYWSWGWEFHYNNKLHRGGFTRNNISQNELEASMEKFLDTYNITS